ncbi:MAG: DUF3168 domain-containing protein [Gemmatimonadota bacterium]
MADAGEVVFKRLWGWIALRALVGKRITPDPPDQDSDYPLVTYQEVTMSPLHSHETTFGTASHRFRVTAWADKLAGSKGARAITAQIDAALVGWSQTELLTRRPRWNEKHRKHGIQSEYRVWNTN